jgi:hypothetical protein
MRGRKLSYDPAGWDEPIWEVVFADTTNEVVRAGLTAGDAMRFANETNVTARRRGGRIVAVKEIGGEGR